MNITFLCNFLWVKTFDWSFHWREKEWRRRGWRKREWISQITIIRFNKFYLTICSYHVTYAFQSLLYSCLNVKELLARNRRKIWSLSNCNWTQTHNHLVHKRTLNHWAKLANLSIILDIVWSPERHV